MLSSLLDRPAVRRPSRAFELSHHYEPETLAEMVERHGVLPVEVALECALKIAEELRTHPDQRCCGSVSPSTVMVDAEGNLFLRGLGGEGPPADPTAATANLANVLYYLLTGKSCEERRGFAARWLRFHPPHPASLRTLRPDVSPNVEAVYRRMRADRPSERFADLDGLIAALGGCVGNS